MTWPGVLLGIALLVFGLLWLLSGTEPPRPLDVPFESDGDAEVEGPLATAATPDASLAEEVEDAPRAMPQPVEPAEPPARAEPPDAPTPPERAAQDPRKRPEEDPGTGPVVVSPTGGKDVEPREPFAMGFGLAWVEPGTAVIGTEKERVLSEARRRKDEGPRHLIVEWPLHTVEVGGYSIDRYEVTNAQYRRFLVDDAYVEYTTQLSDFRGGEDVAPLIRVAQFLVTRRIPTGDAWLAPDGPGWLVLTRQLYKTNRRVLWETYPGLVFRDDKEVVDEQRTFEAFLFKELRSGIELKFFDRPPPGHWPTIAYPPGEAAHPVRAVSQQDATDFAYWAGKHLPSEVEWEYAARGPGGLRFPWHDDGRGFAEIVNGGRAFVEDELPKTMPVNTRPGGASWVNCYHMLGNVSEWTAGTLYEYQSPEGVVWEQIPDPRLHPWAVVEGWGTHPVARGGSVANDDAIYLRAAFRGWRRPPPDELTQPDLKDPEPPPLYALAPHRDAPRLTPLEWTGFRCARYPEPGRSRVQGVELQVAESEFLTGVKLDFDAFAAAEAVDWVSEGDRPADGTYVLGESRSVIAVAPRDVEVALWGSRGERPDLSKVRSAEDLVALAEREVNIVLGLVQTDFLAKSLWAGNTEDPAAKPTRFAQVEMEPGVHAVVLRHGYLALVSLDGRYAWYLQKKPLQAGNLFVVKSRTGENPHVPAAFRIDEQDDRIEFELFPTLSRPDPELKETYVLRVRLHLETERRVLRGAEDWARHPR